jgi:hypothetical protein
VQTNPPGVSAASSPPPADHALPDASVPYLNLSVTLANKLHDFMLDGASDAYYYELSDNWKEVLSSTFSTLGNAFITLGMIQLYQATRNQTYLTWASSNAQSFWRNGWDTVHGGFYDTYSTNWKNTTCQQTTQPNALFEIDFLRLAAANGSAVWLTRANAVENLLNDRFWSTAYSVVEQSYDVCTGAQSGDVQIEVSIGSYLWATGEWARDTSNSTFNGRMADAASFAENYLWDGASNTLPGGTGSTDCGTTSGYLGFMRSVYADLSGLEDCRKGANENAWGAMGLAELYNISGSSTLLQFTNQDLRWINSTLWDPTYGGYHQDTFRNDTLRSACSSTGDPRDYPGWTEGEMPMFMWQIGQLTGNATETSWAGVAEKWTAEHQWNYTDSNGGDLTCLNSNTLPDPGQDTLYDWVQGSALYTYSTITGPVETQPTVVQPITVNVLESGAPGGTYTVNGCSPSPTTGSTGVTTSFTMESSCPYTISFTNSGGVRWGFITSGAFSSASAPQSTCSSGTCTTASFNADYQARLTVNGGNGVTYSLASETSDGWYKYGDSLTVSSNGIWGRSSGTGTRIASWNLDGGSNTNVATTGTVTTSPILMTAAHTVNFNSVTQHQVTFVNSPSGGGTSVATTNPTISGDTGWYDSGTSAQVSATPNSGYTFSGWSGAGSGSYSGTNNPATVTMNAPITETASFSSTSGGLSLDGSTSIGASGSATATATLTTSRSPDVIIALVTIYTGSSSITISSISSTHLSFIKRGSINNANHESIEEWYAVASSTLSSETITVTFSASAYATGEIFGISGANTASPFDSNPGLPKTATGNSGTAASITGLSTSDANDVIIAGYGAPGGADSVTAGSSYTMIYHGHNPQNFGSEYQIVSSTQSGATVGFTGNTNYWAGIADAVTASTSSPSTVTQPIDVTISESGAPSATYTVNGCNPTPTTGSTGTTASFTMSASCSFTVSFSNSGGLRDGFISGGSFSATSSSQTTCGSGTCSAASFTSDYQARLTVNGGNGVAYSLASETSDGWYKYGDSLTVSSNGIWGRSSGTGYRVASWNIDGGTNTNVATTGTVTTSSITMTAAHTVNFNQATQYQLTLVNSPSAGGSSTTSTSPTISGDTGWYDSGTGVSISATPNSGYTFSSWSGTGSGSYTGSNDPASITMNAAIQETASFSSSSAPTLDGYGHGSCSSPTLSYCAVSISTTNANDVVLLFVYRATGSESYTVSDSAGLTWKVRSIGGSPPAAFTVYYAVTSKSLSSDSIRVSLSSTGSETLQMIALGVAGANAASPFDPGAASECYNHGNVAKGGTMSCSITTTNADDMIVGFAEEIQAGGLTSGSGYTSIAVVSASGIGAAEYERVASAGLQTISFASSASSTQSLYVVGDAIQ